MSFTMSSSAAGIRAKVARFCSHDGCTYKASSTSQDGLTHCMASHVSKFHRAITTIHYKGKKIMIERDRRTNRLKCPCGQYDSRNSARVQNHAATVHGNNAASSTSVKGGMEEDVAGSNSRSSSPASSISESSSISYLRDNETSPISNDSSSSTPGPRPSSSLPIFKGQSSSAAKHLSNAPPPNSSTNPVVSSHRSRPKASNDNVLSKDARLDRTLTSTTKHTPRLDMVVDHSSSPEPSNPPRPAKSKFKAPEGSSSNALSSARALQRQSDKVSSRMVLDLGSSPERVGSSRAKSEFKATKDRGSNASSVRALQRQPDESSECAVFVPGSSPEPSDTPPAAKPSLAKATNGGSRSALSSVRALQKQSETAKVASTSKTVSSSKGSAFPASLSAQAKESRTSAIVLPKLIATSTATSERPKTVLEAIKARRLQKQSETAKMSSTSKTVSSTSKGSAGPAATAWREVDMALAVPSLPAKAKESRTSAISHLSDPSSRESSVADLAPPVDVANQKKSAGALTCKSCRAPLPAPDTSTLRTFKSCEACRAKQRAAHKQWQERKRQRDVERLKEQFELSVEARATAQPASGKRKADAQEGAPAKRARVWKVTEYLTEALFYAALERWIGKAAKKGRLLQFGGGYAVIKDPRSSLENLKGPVEAKIRELGLPMERKGDHRTICGSAIPGQDFTDVTTWYHCQCSGKSAKQSQRDKGLGKCGGKITVTLRLESEKKDVGILGQSVEVEVEH